MMVGRKTRNQTISVELKTEQFLYRFAMIESPHCLKNIRTQFHETFTAVNRYGSMSIFRCEEISMLQFRVVSAWP